MYFSLHTRSANSTFESIYGEDKKDKAEEGIWIHLGKETNKIPATAFRDSRNPFSFVASG